MTFEKGNTFYFLAFILIGAILGEALGALLVKLLPAVAVVNQTLTGPIGFNLEVVSFSLKLSLSSITGIIAGIFIFRKV